MFIQTEETPNPESLKFIPGVNIAYTPMNFLDVSQATNSPLAQKLFELKSVKSVFLGYDFITVTKQEDARWELIKAEILVTIMDFLISGMEAVIKPSSQTSNEDQSKPDLVEDKIVQEIREIIETKVRPAVMQDGGDIVFHEFKDGIVKLELRGACSGCPSSTVTLKSGIENMLKYYVPEVISVESI